MCSLVASVDGSVGTSGKIAIEKQHNFFEAIKQLSDYFSLRSADLS